MVEFDPPYLAVDINDDPPLAVRRQTRSHVSQTPESDSIIVSQGSSSQNHGIQTPPSTPHRSKKRVRFSDPGSAVKSTGLTPFVRRTCLTSSPPSTPRRHSTPTSLWNLSGEDKPISGTLQFAPLRQVLEGRVKRRLRRHKLSEELNIIEWDDRQEKKARKTEIEKLKEQLLLKDQELQQLREDQDLASQLGDELGAPATPSRHTSGQLRDLQRQIIELKAELEKRESRPANDDAGWTVAARDPFDENDETFMMPNYDDDFNQEMTDMFVSTPARRSFPSPPSTMPNTPSKPSSGIDASVQAAFTDIESLELKSQLRVLQAGLATLSASLELTNTSHERLMSKLSQFMNSTDSSEHAETLDAALDTVLTQLALAQCSELESAARFTALSSEIKTLGFPSNASSPESVIELLRSQFRTARLDLEYLTPGENPEGFENDKLLGMLVSRLKVLVEKCKSQESDIDQYHEQEMSLRKQLGQRVDATAILQRSLNSANEKVVELDTCIGERDESLSKLARALESYRDEVKGLETVITRLEDEHQKLAISLRLEVDAAKKDGEDKVLTEALKQDSLQAVSEGQELLIVELESRLNAALDSAKSLQAEIEHVIKEKDTAITLMQSSSLDREREHGEALALRDARVSELRGEVERVNIGLKEAHVTIMDLRRENGILEGQVEGEKKRGQIVIEAMRGQLARVLETGVGYLSGSISVRGTEGASGSRNTPIAATTTTPQTVVGKGRYLDASLARKQGGQSKKRRRYDSGLGFLEEGDEMDEMA